MGKEGKGILFLLKTLIEGLNSTLSPWGVFVCVCVACARMGVSGARYARWTRRVREELTHVRETLGYLLYLRYEIKGPQKFYFFFLLPSNSHRINPVFIFFFFFSMKCTLASDCRHFEITCPLILMEIYDPFFFHRNIHSFSQRHHYSCCKPKWWNKYLLASTEINTEQNKVLVGGGAGNVTLLWKHEKY